jgi:hypothetical protein
MLWPQRRTSLSREEKPGEGANLRDCPKMVSGLPFALERFEAAVTTYLRILSHLSGSPTI